LSVPVRDAAGKLNEIVGPIHLSAGSGLEDLEGALHKIAGQTAAVVERLQRSQRETLRAEQLAAVGPMAAGMAHDLRERLMAMELRNPRMAMKVLVQATAARGPRAVLKGRDLTVLDEEISRLEGLTRTLLDFARPPQLQPRAFDARDLVAPLVGLLSGRAEQQ